MENNRSDLLSVLEDSLTDEELKDIDDRLNGKKKQPINNKNEESLESDYSRDEDDGDNTYTSDRHTVEPVYEEMTPFTEKELLDDSTKASDRLDRTVSHPNATFKEYEEFIESINNLNSTVEDFQQGLTKLQQLVLFTNIKSPATTVRKNTLAENMNMQKDEYVNNVVFGEKQLNTRPINFQTKDKLSTASALARFNAFLGTGEVTQVPLWHSGFWVTLRPIKQKDFVNLTIALNDNAIILGRYTNALIYSNYSVVFVRIVMDFIISNIVDTSLNLKDEDIRKYIRVQDIYTLINGILTAMYPRGIEVVKSCENTLKLDDDNKPVCDFIATGTVDTKKLLWVNRKALTNKHLSHMSNRQPNSVSISEVLEYQNTMQSTREEVVKIDIGDDKWIKFTIKDPTLLDYVTIGEQWVTDIVTNTEKVFEEKDSEAVKQSKINDATMAARMNMYNSYIVKIETSDGSKFVTSEQIVELLNVVSMNDNIYIELAKAIQKHIDESAIAIIATPNYTCPKCKEVQKNTGVGAFKEFIPLNLLESFFDLSDQRMKSIRRGDTF